MVLNKSVFGHLTHTIYLKPPFWVGDGEMNYVLIAATHPARPKGQKMSVDTEDK